MLTSLIVLTFVLIFIGTRLYNYIGKHIVQHHFKTPMHQYLGTVYPKPKTFKWIYDKNVKQKWIPNLFREHNIYLFQSNQSNNYQYKLDKNMIWDTTWYLKLLYCSFTILWRFLKFYSQKNFIFSEIALKLPKIILSEKGWRFWTTSL